MPFALHAILLLLARSLALAPSSRRLKKEWKAGRSTALEPGVGWVTERVGGALLATEARLILKRARNEDISWSSKAIAIADLELLSCEERFANYLLNWKQTLFIELVATHLFLFGLNKRLVHTLLAQLSDGVCFVL
jgi:hypothetical protein